MTEYDVAVIGAGPGGYVAAIRAAQLGAKVALIEKESLGGVCLNRGCIPTKTLIACADVYSRVRSAAEFGVRVEGPVSFDWSEMQARKEKTVTGLRQGVATLMKSNRVDVLAGNASFLDRRRITVTGPEEKTDTIAATATIIATGSESVIPAFVPKADNILDSWAALSCPKLPESIIILGGGVIGCEFACLYARLGLEVTIVEMLPEILPTQDREAARVVRTQMKKLGVTVLTDARMTDIVCRRNTVAAKAGDATVKAKAMLVCVGRRPVTQGLNLDAAGLQTDEMGLIPVNEKCRTKAPGIYAVGDVTGMIQLAHRASAMGICAANNAAGRADTHSDCLVPSCIFTSPEIGAVGLTQEQAEEDGMDVRIGKFPFAALGKAQAVQETAGFCKIIADADTDQVLGVHIVGPHATDIVAEAAAAMTLEITAAELARTIHAHPTLAEAVMEAAHAVHGQCIHMPRTRRRA